MKKSKRHLSKSRHKRRRRFWPWNLERLKTRKSSEEPVSCIVLKGGYRIEESVREDIAIIKASPLIKKDTQIIGLAYDVNTGILTEVEEVQREL